MKECDRLSLVTYDSNVQRQCELTKMDKANKEMVKRLVKGITDGSSTNLCGGLVTGRRFEPLNPGCKIGGGFVHIANT